MKTLVCVLLVALASVAEAQAPEALAEWKYLHAPDLKFAISLPPNWEIADMDANGALFLPKGNEFKEGFPEFPNPWVLVTKVERSECLSVSDTSKLVFTPQRHGLDGEFSSAIVCAEGFELLLGYWERDSQKLEKKLMLVRMVRSLRKVP